MGIFLGVATALAWGSADFVARFATRTLGSIRTVFWMQLWGALFLSFFLWLQGDWGHLLDHSGWQPWAWGALAGAINTFAMLALYRAFEIGKLAIVGPISASYPALTVLLSLFSGERLVPQRWLGIIAALFGVLLVAFGERKPSATEGSDSVRQESHGVLWAVAASLSFGVLFWLLGVRIIPRTGALATVWLIRVTGVGFTAVAGLFLNAALRLTSRSNTAQTAVTGLLDTSAFALSNVGMGIEQVSVVSVLGSLYGAVTVALAALFLRERIARLQWIGIAAIFLGVVLMNR
ncbi:MAG TPA: DMT family transporter [Dongiaceae bacterium]|nr:DMT family transporter [Dongiaceae bacterium]